MATTTIRNVATEAVVFNKVVGSSYQMPNARNVDDEMTMNMFFEPLASKQNESEYPGILRSVDGTEIVDSLGESGIARGLHSTSYGYGGNPELWACVGERLYVKSVEEGITELAAKVQSDSASSPVHFAESGGVDQAVAVMVEGSAQLMLYSLKDAPAQRDVEYVDNPKNPYNPDSEGNPQTAHPTAIVSMANRLIINDEGTGQIFISRNAGFGKGTISVYQYNVYDKNGSLVAGSVLGKDLGDYNYVIEDGGKSSIMYESDGNTPDYATVTLNSYSWLSDAGAYQYETALSYTGDAVVAMEAINNNRLIVLGKKSYDVWELSDSTDGYYSIDRTTTGNNIGCGAPHSVAKVNNNVCWLGAGADGYNGIWTVKNAGEPQKISTPALDRKLLQFGDKSDAIGFGYSHAGHFFYVLSFPTQGFTIVFDFLTGYWHNRSTIDPMTGADLMWEESYAQEWNGEVYFLLYSNTELVRAKDGLHTEWDGRNIRKLRRWAPIISDFSPIVVNEMRIECGVGLTKILQPTTGTGALVHETEGYNPIVMLRTSPDGVNFGSFVQARLGLAGNYSAECRWFRLGFGKYFVCEVSLTDPVDFYISDSKIRYNTTWRF